jgi:glycosyltransferase involved in cell wall biosynthesis
MKPLISLIIPTRDRAEYLQHSIRTCMENKNPNVEILVLNNASTDDTDAVLRGIADPRVRYFRSETRLSMRDNFEKGIELSRGEVICFIGDDDGVLPNAVDSVISIFDKYQVGAVSAARAHYFWPDLSASRKNTALLPRGHGLMILDSRCELRKVLVDNNYYRLPCIYHGFVKRDIVDRIKRRQGRFFLSSQVDVYSSIAIAMEGIKYCYSNSPLVINGGSSRSNGASHSGAGTEHEKKLWKQEDDLGLLPGFENNLTIGALILESAIRYGDAFVNKMHLSEIFDISDCVHTLMLERYLRLNAGQSVREAEHAFQTAGLEPSDRSNAYIKFNVILQRLVRLVRSYIQNYPIDMKNAHVINVHQAAQLLNLLMSKNLTGLFKQPLNQLKAAAQIASK